jgi:molybdopterin-containing oxidoreductase family membrane subunit
MAMARITYREIDGGTAYWSLLLGLAALVLIGLGSAWYMEHHGHIVSGMSNRIVWGIPHVFAIFLILAASGVLNVASIASVFDGTPYKPLARLSGLMAIALLVGGLAVLVLDLGRPERLVVAMTTYNFQSIFAWNIFLYTGFLVVVTAYLFVQMEPTMTRHIKAVGWFALVWRLVLTSGTGSIFGWLVARQAYDAAIMAPLFIAMSFAYGLAVFILVLMTMCKINRRPLGGALVNRLGKLLGVFAGAVLYMTAMMHLTNIYAAEHSGVERFILADGGIYTLAFWLGHVVVGCLAPMGLMLTPKLRASRGLVALASGLVIVGAIAHLYVIIIGGQAFPLLMFPGQEVSSSFFDGVIAPYSPSLPEFGLALGGVALALAITLAGMRLLRFMPQSLADDDASPAANQSPA